jgi:hypothetical protein
MLVMKTFLTGDLPSLAFNGGASILTNSLYAEYLPIDRQNIPAGYTPPVDQLVGLAYTLSYIQVWSPTWKSILSVKPGIFYDGESASGNIYRVQGSGVLLKTFAKGWDAGLGGGVTNDFGESDAIPIIVLRYNSGSEKGRSEPGTHLVNLNIPVQASYYYAISRGFQAGAAALVSGGMYRLTRGPLEGDTIRFSIGTVGPSIRLTPYDHWMFELTGGTTFERKFNIRQNETQVADFDLKNSAFGRFTASVQF